MLEKGNVWYVRHYEQYFDEVHVAYLFGKKDQSYSQGHTHLTSIAGSFGGSAFDLLLAPYRLLQFARKVKPSSYLTGDIVFTWWTSLFVRIMLNAHIVLMPVCLPEDNYANSGKSVSGILPIWLERLFIKLTFFSADRIIASVEYESHLQWLESDVFARKKTRRVTALVEEFPSPEFYRYLKGNPESLSEEPGATLLYVGRLHPDKLPMDLISMMSFLKDWSIEARLEIVGDGQDRQLMEAKVTELELSEQVVFHGAMSNSEIIPLYNRATIYVSTLTGTSLREAGLMGLPIVAYDLSWVKELLRDRQTALLARARDPEDLAKNVTCALGDSSLREKIGKAFRMEARRRWSMDILSKALHDAFEEDAGIPA